MADNRTATKASSVGGEPHAATHPVGPHAGPPGVTRGLASMGWTAYGLLVGLIIIWTVFAVETGGLFLSARNLTLLLVQAVVLSIAACGMVFVMVAGHIDLSVGSAVGLIATLVAYTESVNHFGALASIGVAILTGLGIGTWQGFWVAYLKVPAFIVTLASMMLLRGITYIISQGQTFTITSSTVSALANGRLSKEWSIALVLVAALLVLVPIPERWARYDLLALWVRQTSRRVPILLLLGLVGYIAAAYRGIPYAVFVVAVLASILSFVGSSTMHGRRIYAIGGEVEAAKRAGINVRHYVFMLFVLMGLLYALDGTVLASRLGGAPPDPALFLELNAITAAIIGGTSLFGGVGRVGDALLGALLLTSLSNGMELMNVSTFYQYVAQGLVLLIAVLADIALKERRWAQ